MLHAINEPLLKYFICSLRWVRRRGLNYLEITSIKLKYLSPRQQVCADIITFCTTLIWATTVWIRISLDQLPFPSSGAVEAASPLRKGLHLSKLPEKICHAQNYLCLPTQDKKLILLEYMILQALTSARWATYITKLPPSAQNMTSTQPLRFSFETVAASHASPWLQTLMAFCAFLTT